MHNLVFVNLVEGNANGRIVKVREIEKRGFAEIHSTSYVVHAPSRLVAKPVRVKGRFTSQKVMVPEACTMEQRTGWMLTGRYDFLSAARDALGINTSPKRESAIAAAVKLAA